MLTASVFEKNMTRSENLPVLGGSAVVRNNAVSTFVLDIDGNSDLWADFVGDHDPRGYHVRIQDDGADILSGIILEYDTKSKDRTRTITLSGQCHLFYLDSFITLPSPDRAVDNQTARSHYQDSGPAGTIINTMVNRHRGQGSIAENRTPLRTDSNLIFPGGNATIRSRYENLLEVAQDAALAGNVRFSTAIRDGVIRFIVDEPTDRHRDIRLKEQNNALTAYELTEAAPTATRALVAGQGEGSNRLVKLVEEPEPNPWGVDILTFIDRRDTDDEDELVEAGESTLADNVAGASVNLTAADLPGLQYGRDFIVGDKITAQLEGGVPVVDALQRAELNWSETGRTVDLHVGPYLEETSESKTLDLVRKLRSQLRRLQA